MKGWLEAVWIGTGALLLSIYYFHSLLGHLATSLVDPYDPSLTAYLIDWIQSQPLRKTWSPPFFWPEAQVMATTENFIGLAWASLPLKWLVRDPIVLVNLLWIGAFMLTPVAIFWWLRVEGFSVPVAMVTALVTSFSSWRFLQIGHLQLLYLCFLPAALASFRRGYILVGWFFLACQAYATTGLIPYFIPLVLAWIVLEWARSGAGWRRATEWGSGLLLFALATLPLAVPYWNKFATVGYSRSLEEIRGFSLHWADLLTPLNEHWFYAPAEFSSLSERQLFPGLVWLLLFAAGLAGMIWKGAPTRHWSYLVLVGLAIWFSLGPSAGAWSLAHLPYDLGYEWVPGFDALRVPVRFLLLAGLFAAPIMACGVNQILGRPYLSRHPASGLLIVGLAFLDALPHPAPAVDIQRDDWERQAARIHGAKAAVFLPLREESKLWEEVETLWWSRQAGVPVVNGYSSYIPRWYRSLWGLQAGGTGDGVTRRAVLSYLQAAGVDRLVLRAGATGHSFLDEKLLDGLQPGVFQIPADPLFLEKPLRLLPGLGPGELLPASGWHAFERDGASRWMWSSHRLARLAVPLPREPTELALLLSGTWESSTEIEIRFDQMRKQVTVTKEPRWVRWSLEESPPRTWGRLELATPRPQRPPVRPPNAPDSRRLGVCLFEIQVH